MDRNQDERIIGMGYCQPVFMGNKCEWDDRMIGDMMGHMSRETKLRLARCWNLDRISNITLFFGWLCIKVWI